MKRYLAYLRAVLRHKYFVFIECRKLGVPFWIAFFHDWDKFLPDEFIPYARTFYKPDGSKQYVESVDFAKAWMLHQHRNKHHWQYWLRVWVKRPDMGVGINHGADLRDTNIFMWDRGIAQEIVERETVGGVRFELRDIDDALIDTYPMPDLARREMLADWRGAGRAYNENWTRNETLTWYEKNKAKIRLHPNTREWIETQLLYGTT